MVGREGPTWESAFMGPARDRSESPAQVRERCQGSWPLWLARTGDAASAVGAIDGASAGALASNIATRGGWCGGQPRQQPDPSAGRWLRDRWRTWTSRSMAWSATRRSTSLCAPPGENSGHPHREPAHSIALRLELEVEIADADLVLDAGVGLAAILEDHVEPHREADQLAVQRLSMRRTNAQSVLAFARLALHIVPP